MRWFLNDPHLAWLVLRVVSDHGQIFEGVILRVPVCRRHFSRGTSNENVDEIARCDGLDCVSKDEV